MKRLTKRCNGIVTYIGASNEYETGQIACEVEPQGVRELLERLAAYEDTRLTPELVRETAELAIWVHDNGIEKIKKWIKADKDGRVVVLPCKVGDTVWANLDGMRHPRKCVIEFANIGSHVTTIVFSTVDGLREQYGVNPSSFGKTVFLTREEAEKALEAMKK